MDSELDLLDAEAAMQQRLREQIKEVKLVASTAAIVGLQHDGLTPHLPALFTHPGPAEVTDYAGNGQAQAEQVEWVVVAVVKLLPDPTMQSNFSPAGKLLGQAVRALAGWKPLAHYRPLRYLGRDEPEFSPGYAEFPLRFAALRMFSGTGGS
jgi:hypothetical protein